MIEKLEGWIMPPEFKLPRLCEGAGARSRRKADMAVLAKKLKEISNGLGYKASARGCAISSKGSGGLKLVLKEEGY